MALSVTVSPSTKSAVYRPVIWEVFSDRNNSLYYAVTGVTSGTGAKARFAMASHTFLVGDVITGSGFTGTSTVYNVVMTVAVVAAGYVETDLDYSVVSAGSPILTRTNENFKVKAEVYTFDQTAKTISGTANAAGDLEVTTSAAHGYSAGDIIMQEGTTDYNGTFKVKTIVSSTKYTITETYTSSQTGTVRKGTFIGSQRVSAITISSIQYFRFNVANMLQSALSSQLNAIGATAIVTPTANAIKWYAVHFTEEFDDAEGLVYTTDSVTSTDSKVSNALQAVRTALQHTDTQSLSLYTLGTTSKKFLSNAPTTRKIRVGEEEQLSFLANAGDEYSIGYEQYDLMGVSLGANLTGGFIPIIDGRGIFPVYAALVTSSISKVDVWLETLASGRISEKITFVIDNSPCSTALRIWFENTRGGFDTFTFTGSYKHINNVKRTMFKRDLGTSFSVSDRGDTTLGLVASKGIEVFSRFLSRAEGVWLCDLINSPNVFIQSGTSLIPITILNANDPMDDTDGPAQLKLQFAYANDISTLTN